MPTDTLKINAEITKLSMNTLMELYVIDATDIDGDIWYFHPGTQELAQPIIWQGNVYHSLPIKVDGFKFTGKAELPRPKLMMANLNGTMTALCLQYEDLLGAKVIRKRTYAKYLDGMAEADTAAHFPDDIFFIERKTAEGKDVVEFELASSLDVDGVLLPRRQIITNSCVWKYRGAECGFSTDQVVADRSDVVMPAGTVIGEWSEATVYNTNDVVWRFIKNRRFYYKCKSDGVVGISSRPPLTSLWQADECSKRLAGCKLRFGATESLPFGGFPGTRKAVGGS